MRKSNTGTCSGMFPHFDILKDQMAWLAMDDLAPDQPSVVLNSIVEALLNPIPFYPNPAKYILYFN